MKKLLLALLVATGTFGSLQAYNSKDLATAKDRNSKVYSSCYDYCEAWSNRATAQLQGANLAGVNLSGGAFGKADFQNANLKGANLSRANLTSANLTNADLEDTDWSGVNIHSDSITLTGANLTGANLSGHSFLSGVSLIRVNLTGANLAKTNLVLSNLKGACMYNVQNYRGGLPTGTEAPYTTKAECEAHGFKIPKAVVKETPGQRVNNLIREAF